MLGNELHCWGFLGGVKQREISVQLEVRYMTIKRFRKTDTATPDECPGRPKILTERVTHALQRVVRSDRFSPLGDITNRLNSSLVTTLHYKQSENTFMMKVLVVMQHRMEESGMF